MKDWGISLPVELLVYPHLTASAKLVWMLHAARHLTRTRQVDPWHDGGLSRPTVLAAMRQLEQADWAVPKDATAVRRAAARWRAGLGVGMAPTIRGVAIMPVHLLTDVRLPAQAKVLYGALQAVPGFDPQLPGGQFTYAALHVLTGTAVNTLKAAAGQLVRSEWLDLAQTSRVKPISVRLLNAVALRADMWIASARSRIEGSNNRAETIMRELLSLLVESEVFEDDAEPGYLINPMTQEPMQFDRFYPPSTAFEYNGPHHYGPTKYCSLEDSLAQQGRDLMKAGHCANHGVRLVVIHRSDLSLAGMRERLAGLDLPMRDLTGLESVARFLDGCGMGYQRS